MESKGKLEMEQIGRLPLENSANTAFRIYRERLFVFLRFSQRLALVLLFIFSLTVGNEFLITSVIGILALASELPHLFNTAQNLIDIVKSVSTIFLAAVIALFLMILIMFLKLAIIIRYTLSNLFNLAEVLFIICFREVGFYLKTTRILRKKLIVDLFNLVRTSLDICLEEVNFYSKIIKILEKELTLDLSYNIQKRIANVTYLLDDNIDDNTVCNGKNKIKLNPCTLFVSFLYWLALFLVSIFISIFLFMTFFLGTPFIHQKVRKMFDG